MCTTSIYELRTNLSKYLKKIKENEEEEIIVTNNGVAVAKIVPFEEPKKGIIFGTGKQYLKGKKLGDPFLGDDEITNDLMEATK